MPILSDGPRWTTRLRPLSRAYSTARGSRTSCRLRSSAMRLAPRSIELGLCGPAPKSPSTTEIRWRATTAVDAESATAVVIFRPDHRPLNRERNCACSPKSRTSCVSAGYSVGIARSASVASLTHGRLDRQGEPPGILHRREVSHLWARR